MIINKLTRIVPTRREKDPTGQAGRRTRAKADIAKRVRELRDQVLDILYSIPVQSIQVNKTTYRYDANPDRIDSLFDELLGIFYQVLELNQPRRAWFFNDYLGPAWQQGTAQAFERIKTLAEAAVPDVGEAMQLDSVLSSPEYTSRFEIISARAFENMKGFAGQAAQELGGILGRGVAMGESPRTIARDIRRKFKQVEGYRAERIARTEVNNAYTEARYETNRDARDRLGLDVMVMHVSALVPNTRPTHASRHGRLYTLEQQRSWWSEGSQKINCLCSTVEVILIDGEPTQQKLIERQRKRGKAYFAMYPEKRRAAPPRQGQSTGSSGQ
jgi:SPP1 gp7 family putative phage head morphogenesis protein